MTKSEWHKKAADLAAAHNALSDATLPQIRRALIELDQLLRGAPTAVQQQYKKIDEATLRALAIKAQSNLDDGTLAWIGSDLIESAGAQTRALDLYLYQHREVRGKPEDAMTDFLCTKSKVHAIPRPLAKPPKNPDHVSTTTYRRRGIIWHRLLPQVTSDGYKVILEWHRDMALAFRQPDAEVLAALFQDLTLVRDKDFANFVASDAPCSDEDGAITIQAAAAYRPSIVLALWPELTMPEGRRIKLQEALKAQSKINPLGAGPSFAAAGSWHEIEGRAVRNRMHVLSRSGAPRFYHDKTLPLESKTLGTEELAPSHTVSVLIGEDALIAFAICRDFCEAQIARVYLELDVDLVVVPSYGDKKTIRAHRQQALNLSTDPGTRAFVVQQIVPEEVASSGAGYVLAPDTDLAEVDAFDLVANDCAKSHPISFKRV